MGYTGTAVTDEGYNSDVTDVGYGSGLTDVSDTGADLTLTSVNAGIGPATAVPEASTWAMMLLGFAGLAFMGWYGSRKTFRTVLR